MTSQEYELEAIFERKMMDETFELGSGSTKNLLQTYTK